MLRIAYVIPSFLLVSSCTLVDPEGSEGNSHLDDWALEELSVEETYDVESTFGITAGSVLPEPAASALKVLQDFDENPARTMLQLLDDAGVPLLGELRSLLPSQLEDELEDWMNEYIADAVFEKTPVDEVIASVLDQAQTVLTQIELQSELELSAPDPDGRMSAIHRAVALRYQLEEAGIDVSVPISAELDGLFTIAAATEAEISPPEPGTAADATLTLDSHAFGLPYGDHVYAALELVARAQYGMSLRDSLATIVNCPAMAESVATKCIGPICVGNRDKLEAICEKGIDLLVARLGDELHELAFDAITLTSGQAEMYESGESDGVLDLITAGTWDAAIDIGMGPRQVPAAFHAVGR